MPTELGQFPRNRRERVDPEAVGLEPDQKPQRVPGLRREEPAPLAGVSLGYYTRLEQGVSSTSTGSTGCW
ncbi:hypothetical protein GCM10009539_73840 [Cryptosporangium japonicum]|uniref:Uncharacterized protein n=1 Tax=Cryptosporangium japonicum TaxID=80872 RepID=A0ABP3ERU0_9ACTN